MEFDIEQWKIGNCPVCKQGMTDREDYVTCCNLCAPTVARYRVGSLSGWSILLDAARATGVDIYTKPSTRRCYSAGITIDQDTGHISFTQPTAPTPIKGAYSISASSTDSPEVNRLKKEVATLKDARDCAIGNAAVADSDLMRADERIASLESYITRVLSHLSGYHFGPHDKCASECRALIVEGMRVVKPGSEGK